MTFRLVDKGWDSVLADARRADTTVVRIVCPFIQRKPIERLLKHGKPKTLQVITRFNLDDFCDGVSDIAAVRCLLEHGAQIRGIRNLHAKMYLLGKNSAIVSSANLTDAALLRNHEFGFVAQDPGIVAECRKYFDGLWARAVQDLTMDRLDQWEVKIAEFLATGGSPQARSGLGDQGVNAGIPVPTEITTISQQATGQAFVKFFGRRGSAVSHATNVLDEVTRSGSHWACAYGKRPRRLRDGAVVYMSRIVENPNDILIYGRAIGLRHVEGRDDATSEDIELRSWKKMWPYYVRVHHAEFIAGTLGDGVSLYDLMRTLGSDAFAATQRNAKKGSGNTNPRTAYQQQPAVELTVEGAQWLHVRLERAFDRHGKIPPVGLESLDWPTVLIPGMKGAK